MPSKKKRYNARFPPARIKKIMQTDEDVGKVAAAVPVIISRALELFIESLILKSNETTQSRHAKTLSTAHIKQTIEAEKKFDFLRDLVACIPDHQNEEDGDTSNSSETKKPRVPRQRKPKADGAGPSKRADRKNSSDSSHLEVDEDEDEETESDDENERLMNTPSGASPRGVANSSPYSSEESSSKSAMDQSDVRVPNADHLKDTNSHPPSTSNSFSPARSNTDTSPVPAVCTKPSEAATGSYYPMPHGFGPSVSHMGPSSMGYPRPPMGGTSSALTHGQCPQPYSVPFFNHSVPVSSGPLVPHMYSNLHMYKPPPSEDDDYDA